MQGNVKHFNHEKGYGFISGEGADVFVHISQVIGQDLSKGDLVNYDLREGRKGPEAANVQVVQFNNDI